jgi:hypothetical protein
MPRSRKIDQTKIQASLDAQCPKCGELIPPAKVKRVDFDRMRCPSVETYSRREKPSSGGNEIGFLCHSKRRVAWRPRARQEARRSTIESGFRRDVPVPTSMEGRR